jgi:O-antigen ligase
MYAELLVGFLFILVLSDSRQLTFAFADDIKNVYAVFLGLFMITDSQRFKPWDGMIKLFLPFLMVAYLCVMFSPIMLTSLQKTFSFTLLLIIVPNYVVVALKQEGWVFLHMLLWSLLVFLLAGLALKYISLDFVTLSGRFNGLMGNPNSIGLFAVTTLVFITVLSEFKPDLLSQFEKVFGYAVIVASLIFSGSRNAMFAGLIFIGFRFLYKLSPAIGFFIFVLMIVVYQYVESNFASIVTALGIEQFFRLETLQSGSGRLVAWEFGWEWIGKSPILGQGWGFTEDLYTHYKEVLSIRGHQGNAHNSYITFWLDTGIVGVLLYLVGLLRAFFKCAKYTRSAIPLMYAVLFHAFFESWLTGSLNPFTIQLIILLTIMTYIPELEAADKENEELSAEGSTDQIPARPAF